jgi:hypothetical protein
VSSSRCGEEICSTSFFHVGQSLIAGEGYDFMSDVGSETTRYTASSVGLPTGNNTPSTRGAARQKTPPVPAVAVFLSGTSSLVSEDLPAEELRPHGLAAVDENNPMLQLAYSDCGVPLLFPPLMSLKK